MSDPNANRSGYKETKAGWIPEDWECVVLAAIADLQTGIAKGKAVGQESIELPYLRVANVQDGRVDLREVKTIMIDEKDVSRFSLVAKDVLFTEGGDFDKLGRGCVWNGEIQPCLHQNHVFAVRCRENACVPLLLAAIAAGPHGRRYFALNSKQSTNLASINSSQLKAFPLPLPSFPEQKKIAEILSTYDAVIEKTEELIDAKKRQKRALMQQLLIGKKRLPGFDKTTERKSFRFFDVPSDWDCPLIRDVSTEHSVRNAESQLHVVLTCSKRLGFVESKVYFKKQVFSSDRSNYKVVRKGWFGFPSNHVEEGSIGLLTSHDSGIVSPIYTVFETTDQICPEFLYAVFKTETFKHIFSVTTNASVDRRGSLKWDAFSSIRIPCPPRGEQEAIAKIDRSANGEIEILNRKLKALKTQKSALMQKLLTGQIRVKL